MGKPCESYDFEVISDQPSPEVAPLPKYPTHIDTLEGRILVGNVAIEACLEAGSHPLDLQDLEGVLRNEGYAEIPEIPPLDVTDWTRQNYVEYARWLVGVLSSDTTRRTLSRDILMRAYQLGLGPSLRRIKAPSRFGSLSNLYREAEAPSTRPKKLFADWNDRDFITWYKEVGDELRGKPTEKQLWKRVQSGHYEPSPITIRERFGSLSVLSELANYTDVRIWTEEDYIDWGANYMLEHDGKLPSARRINELSRAGRGPSGRTIANKFGLISNYHKLIKEKYELERERQEKERQEKAATVNELLSQRGYRRIRVEL